MFMRSCVYIHVFMCICSCVHVYMFMCSCVYVHVFIVFIFSSETMRRDHFKLRLGFIFITMIIAIHFFYHMCTTAMHYKVCTMQWQCSGLVLCCTDSIPRGCSYVCGDSLALYNLCWFVVTASELDQQSLTPLSLAG